jgi:hypothetical protein
LARKPNYSFERMERERARALKLTEKAAAKRERREAENPPSAAQETDSPSPDEQT